MYPRSKTPPSLLNRCPVNKESEFWKARVRSEHKVATEGSPYASLYASPIRRRPPPAPELPWLDASLKRESEYKVKAYGLWLPDAPKKVSNGPSSSSKNINSDQPSSDVANEDMSKKIHSLQREIAKEKEQTACLRYALRAASQPSAHTDASMVWVHRN
mmetsp:Transcript_16778/g.30410  ORF Transcript_16778/g.30410 Transcript_16778/m.30410 type:complete len:159 (-) Transcript_16778:2003-2479(-)|eukprot:CAMPEP_0175040512 /NCGR_PEP_ID=MMETSP0052_2-20121109/1310_1 /TAXON_ID=51329 ORGANISM="Polytomella parva, Strain SAG 63-3" /NCGR_SAMPLE_ID=MMETSP0052_2 /ASSEMBLY_ACC=CAM_ASM_000194 /LENGTH=158 /DNA_ID=CAMNT_0016302743 /DNA_START=31 /DNA_END=507 /DNA_ORIENTATION=-